MLKIGPIQLKNRVVLAPIAGVLGDYIAKAEEQQKQKLAAKAG